MTTRNPQKTANPWVDRDIIASAIVKQARMIDDQGCDLGMLESWQVLMKLCDVYESNSDETPPKDG